MRGGVRVRLRINARRWCDWQLDTDWRCKRVRVDRDELGSTKMVRWPALEHDDGAIGSSTAAVGGVSTSERISTDWEHDDGAFGSSTAVVGGAITSERISSDWEHDDVAVGCCFARRKRWEERFLVREG